MASLSIAPKKKRALAESLEEALLPNERVFAAEYISNGFNATQAAGVAFPRAKKTSIGEMGKQVLKRPRVKNYISKMLHAKLETQGLSTDRILRKLEYILFMDPMDFFEPGDIDGVYKLKSLDDIPAEARECISKLKCKAFTDAVTGDTEVYMEVEFMSKDKALEMAMKYQGLLNDNGVQINIKKDAPVLDFDKLCEPPDLSLIEGTVVPRAALETKEDE